MSFFWGSIHFFVRTIFNVIRLLLLILFLLAAFLVWGWASNVIFGKLTTGQYLYQIKTDFQQKMSGAGSGPILEMIGRVTNLDRALNGQVKTYFESGEIKTEITYKDGHRDGPAKKYWPNGQIQVEGVYKNGALNGPVRDFDEGGQLIRERIFVNGKPVQSEEASEAKI